MKSLLSIFFLILVIPCLAQKGILRNDEAIAHIKNLGEDGALVLRLRLHQKKAELYRNAGNHKVADKIDKELAEKNKLLALIFLDESFNFCPVYIIESENYGRLVNGHTKNIFLDKNLKIDSSIVFKEKNIFFVDIGNVYEVVRVENSSSKYEVTSTPVIQNALVIKTKFLNQLTKPFPFNVPLDGIHINILNFTAYRNSILDKNHSIKDMDSYISYMKSKFKLKKRDIFIAQKIFSLNIRLHSFYFKHNQP